MMSMFFPNLKVGYDWTADKPILLAWLSSSDQIVVPSSLTEWVAANLGTQYAAIEAKQAAIGYARGNPDDKQRFGYAWIYPK